jgi:hypothetical protein
MALSMSIDLNCDPAATHGKHGKRERMEEPESNTMLKSESEQSVLESSTYAN